MGYTCCWFGSREEQILLLLWNILLRNLHLIGSRMINSYRIVILEFITVSADLFFVRLFLFFANVMEFERCLFVIVVNVEFALISITLVVVIGIIIVSISGNFMITTSLFQIMALLLLLVVLFH